MRSSQPCELCGCTQVNLHDGFYFCSECGTQDANFQETIVEVVESAGGDMIHGQKKKLVKVVKEQKEMSDTWYKWHAFNFLLRGIADELLEYGANASFKSKLLWVWTRYVKKYLKKEEMGFNEKPQMEPPPDDEEESDSDIDEPPEELLGVWDATRDKHIKSFSFTLLVTLIFIALNLDKSVITLTHLIKLFRDGLLSVPYRIDNIVPKEMKPEKLCSQIKRGMANFKAPRIRIIAMTLFKRLDLGNPIVPDLRGIVDNFLKELCLPTDLKPLVLSLMHYRPCNFLDVNAKDKVIYKVPAYEFHVMTYIIWAMKLCLGLDCDYEVKLSKAAEAINEKEGRPRSYFINGESDPTTRLFSFREWVTFYQFRQIMLRHHCYRYANKCSWDTDDYIALEHHMDLLQSVWEKDLKDEMAYELLHRIKGGDIESLVVPRSEFKPTITPFHSYSQVIAQYLQDPDVKLKIIEDFSQYSLKYAIEDWNLVNPNSKKKKNLVKGIKIGNKEVTNKYHHYIPLNDYCKKMVYVRNCDNHNWLTTKQPTMEHLVKVDKLNESDDDENKDTVENLSDHPDSEMEEQTDRRKAKSISEISLANTSMSSRIQFEDEENLETNEVKKRKLKNGTVSNKFPDIISDRSFTNSSLSNSLSIEYDRRDPTDKIKLRKLNDGTASNVKFPDVINDKSLMDSTLSNNTRLLDDTKVYESDKLDEIKKKKFKEMYDKIANPYEIIEEAEGVNIFDDDFKPDIKEELDNCAMDYENTYVSENFNDIPTANSQSANNDNESDVTSIDSVIQFNEATFDRANAIREIILFTCKKHKLPVPPEYSLKKDRSKKEMGTFSRSADFITNRIHVYQKRNITHEKERRGIWQGFVTDYHEAMKDDVLNQIAQKVRAAIENADQQANEPPIGDTAYTDTQANNIETDNVSFHSNNNIDTNINEAVQDTTSKKLTESDEDRLFSEESEGETHAKELLPEKNPDFDEDVYDTTQLYVKTAKTVGEGEMVLDPQLLKIISKKIVKDAKDPSLLTWTEERKKLTRPDSEDEMPLSVLQELIVLRKKLSKQEKETLEPFVKEKIENFQYWFKFYYYTGAGVYCRVFEREICDGLPKSLSFLLRQCAHILGVSEGELYKNLQCFETTAVEKCRIKLGLSRPRKLYNFAQF